VAVDIPAAAAIAAVIDFRLSFALKRCALVALVSMQVRFLSGPAGSGKTFRCLAEIRDALGAAPEGPPLIFLAPKQATFQLERQLLADNSLKGYARLQILSFERLARFVFDRLNAAPPDLLSDEGRVMVLRALLLRHEDELKLFRGSARRAGFAQETSRLLNEFQQHQLAPAKLRALAENKNLRSELRDKLRDLALLHERYSAWLAENQLQDANHLLGAATEMLRTSPGNPALQFSALWLDGFAEMTPQEMDLLTAILPFCERATLAFCIDDTGPKENSWLSIWNAVGKTFEQCRRRIEGLPGCKVEVEALQRDPKKSRFVGNGVLRDLEANWQGSGNIHAKPDKTGMSALRIITCQNPEAEAIFAAREILKFVRDGNRFRDCAVLVRDLEPFHKSLARIFRQYEVPFFLDRRESIAHHPLAELTRNALRTVAFDWRHEDWFAALKTGFCPADETEIDGLENESLARGWRGKKWREPIQLPENAALEKRLERLRGKIVGPFEIFYAQLAKEKFQPTGTLLAESLRELWENLRVEETLERWNIVETGQNTGHQQPAIHTTVWEQMNSWLDNVKLAFTKEPIALRDWLPVLDAGLANLTVGVIPPALDEVLIGAVDRARNPELKLCLVLGANETIFPATPAPGTILTDSDRDELNQVVPLGADLRERLARERYYGYIAFTRSGGKLAVTFSQSDAGGAPLNPSSFIAHLRSIFPGLPVEDFDSHIKFDDVEKVNELIPTLVQARNLAGPEKNLERLASSPSVSRLMNNLNSLREPDPAQNLSPALATQLYGNVLRTSVSRLEEFAQCPFKFFIRSGLHAGERKVFELDSRERGTFQHDVLKIFHEQLVKEKKRWRDLTPQQAREQIGQIGALLAAEFRGGLLHDSPQTKFAARAMTESLQDFVEVIVSWMRNQYEFDPAAVELSFGEQDSPAPAWEVDLGSGRKLALRGRIDRVDVCRESDGQNALAVVLDYKSSGKKLEAVLMDNGVQLQLAAYLNALRHFKNPSELFGIKKLLPAGVFYINLRGQFENGDTRSDVLANAAESRFAAYRHTGRFDVHALGKLDSKGVADQFNYKINQDGSLRKGQGEAMPRGEFEALLDGVEAQLRRIGNEIFAGMAHVDPYRKGNETPCEYCDYSAACRIDPWTHRYRTLIKAASTE
jgi:ATP-dependent helicase/nuclease subunit B